MSRLLYYALGGGLGHLVRARAFLHSIGFQGSATLLTASQYARDPRVAAGFEVLSVPNALASDRDEFRSWLLRALAELQPDCMCVDTFPAGIVGELYALPAQLRLWHVARRLRWRAYAKLLPHAAPRFERCWRIEPLAREQERHLAAQCTRIEDLELRDPESPTAAIAEPYWLVVHSGPQAEVEELIAFACEVRAAERAHAPLLVITQTPPPQLPANARVLDAIPAEPYYARAARIFSAAGFNVMRQSARYQAKHHVLPMPRRFDDQFARARGR